MIRPEQMPFTSIAGMRYDSGDYPASVRLCAELLDLPAIRARQQHGEPDGRLIGIGFATLHRADRARRRRIRRRAAPRSSPVSRAAPRAS